MSDVPAPARDVAADVIGRMVNEDHADYDWPDIAGAALSAVLDSGELVTREQYERHERTAYVYWGEKFDAAVALVREWNPGDRWQDRRAAFLSEQPEPGG